MAYTQRSQKLSKKLESKTKKLGSKIKKGLILGRKGNITRNLYGLPAIEKQKKKNSSERLKELKIQLAIQKLRNRQTRRINIPIKQPINPYEQEFNRVFTTNGIIFQVNREIMNPVGFANAGSNTANQLSNEVLGVGNLNIDNEVMFHGTLGNLKPMRRLNREIDFFSNII